MGRSSKRHYVLAFSPVRVGPERTAAAWAHPLEIHTGRRVRVLRPSGAEERCHGPRRHAARPWINAELRNPPREGRHDDTAALHHRIDLVAPRWGAPLITASPRARVDAPRPVATISRPVGALNPRHTDLIALDAMSARSKRASSTVSGATRNAGDARPPHSFIFQIRRSASSIFAMVAASSPRDSITSRAMAMPISPSSETVRVLPAARSASPSAR